MIDVVALRSLQELARTGSVARVAEELGFTPSAISQQLKKLEQQVGVPLTERKGRGVLLTSHGVALAAKASDVFDVLADAAAAAHDTAVRPSGTIKLGGFATACRSILTPAIAALAQTAPELTIAGQEINPEPCVAAVAHGHLDLGVVHNYDKVPVHLPDNVDLELLGYDSTQVLMPATAPLAQRDWVTTDELVDLPWVTHNGIEVCRAMFNQLFAHCAHLPDVVFVADEFATQHALVEAGLAYALFPQLALSLPLPGTVAVPITPNAPKRGIQAIWRKSAGNSAAIVAVRQALRSQSEHVLTK